MQKNVIRIPFNKYIHISDNNLNITRYKFNKILFIIRLEVGP